jgi:uncharacterized damage-inducible protein DinB
MARMIETQELQDTLESILDTQHCSLSRMLEALAEVCDEKAEHILTTWQDRTTAKPWTVLARKIRKAEHLAQCGRI